MRLTLRTMLAYLDEILEPEDHELIRAKIEESEFASDLVRRIQDVTRRLRLGAPPPLGLGIGPDPNTVSEYLDNALSAERVPDFERVCLDADVCLAEVAACHQILTLVLGQPAEVAPASRQRMYRVIEEQLVGERPSGNGHPLQPALSAVSVAPTGEVGSADGAESQVEPDATAEMQARLGPGEDRPSGGPEPVASDRPKRRRPEIPDYLRTSRGTWLRRLSAAAALLAVAAAALFWAFSSGPLEGLLTQVPRQVPSANGAVDAAGGIDPIEPEVDRGSQALETGSARDGSRGAESEVDREPAGSDEPQVVAGADTVSQEPFLEPVPGPAEGAKGTEEPGEGPVAAAVSEEASEPAGDQGAEEATVGPSVVESAEETEPELRLPAAVASSGTPTASELLRSIDPALSGSEQSADAAGLTSAGQEGTDGAAAPLPDAASDAAETDDVAGERGPSGAADEPSRRGDGDDAAAGPADSDAEGKLGHYSNQAVLLRHDPRSDQWLRVAPRSAVLAGQRLLALPMFRPTISLAAGIHVDVVGGTLLSFDESGVDGWPVVDVGYGRLILMNVGQSNNRMEVSFSSQRLSLAFEASGATLAVELHREHEAGVDPEKNEAALDVRLYATSGTVRASLDEGETVLEAPAQWELRAGQLQVVESDAEPPEWTRSEQLSSLDQRAAASLAEALVLDRPAGVILKELVNSQGAGRRSEVRALAARSAVHVGQFEPFVSALGDAEQKVPTWRSHLIETLREALTLSPETAARIHEAFRSQRGAAEGDELFRLLRGFSAEDLEQGGDEQLVNYLEHEKLDIRILALWNLVRMTGLGQPGRLPDPKVDRPQGIRAWRKRLTDGQIVPRSESGS